MMLWPQFHIFWTLLINSAFSGYKINWTKSVLFPLNSNLDVTLLSQHILVVKQFKYLGVDIFPSLASIANKKFLGIYNKIETDLVRWSYLPKSLQARVSVVKMDILLRINFFSSMLPLPPPTDCWKTPWYQNLSGVATGKAGNTLPSQN